MLPRSPRKEGTEAPKVPLSKVVNFHLPHTNSRRGAYPYRQSPVRKMGVIEVVEGIVGAQAARPPRTVGSRAEANLG
jgi:hypothetical protein